MGEEPSGLAGRSLGEVWLSLTMLTKVKSVLWGSRVGSLYYKRYWT